jgi:two-component system, chemotaxis family, chemotaxis protein CheY
VRAKPKTRAVDGDKPKNVLVVDDDEDFLAVIVNLLAAAGYEVGWAVNGQDALEEIRKGGAPSLIFLDMHMPVMTGAEFLDIRMRDPELSKVPIVVMSAHAVAFARNAFGVVDIILKPFSFDDLLRIAKRYTGPNVTH